MVGQQVHVYHRETCRLCESPRVELAVAIAPIPLAEKYVTADQRGTPTELYPVDLYICLDCGHVHQLDVVDPAVLWQDYTYHSGQTKGIVEHFQEVARELTEGYQLAPGNLAVDVGSNDGSLLRCFQQRGLRVVGVDPARDIAARATAAGIETIPALLSAEVAARIREEHGPASLVTAFNAFAHTDDLRGMTTAIRDLLAPDGIFVFEAQYLLDIIDHTLLGTIFHEHMSHHSVTPLKRFLESLDLELVDVRRVSIQKGSIIGTVQRRGGPHALQPSVEEFLALERERQLTQPAAIRSFGAKLQELKARLGTLLEEWRERGAVVAAYGAARSGPTLINQLGLEGHLRYIFDDHPQKVHKYSPGHHIPVLPTADLYRLKPDYVVILAWIHAKKIIADNHRFLEEGGHFVTCCPDVAVV